MKTDLELEVGVVDRVEEDVQGARPPREERPPPPVVVLAAQLPQDISILAQLPQDIRILAQLPQDIRILVTTSDSLRSTAATGYMYISVGHQADHSYTYIMNYVYYEHRIMCIMST